VSELLHGVHVGTLTSIANSVGDDSPLPDKLVYHLVKALEALDMTPSYVEQRMLRHDLRAAEDIAARLHEDGEFGIAWTAMGRAVASMLGEARTTERPA
jgi:hypothetical protein